MLGHIPDKGVSVGAAPDHPAGALRDERAGQSSPAGRETVRSGDGVRKSMFSVMRVVLKSKN